MKKSELIKQLEAIEGDPEVIIASSNTMEQNGANVPVSHLHESKEGEIKDRKCTDAFDYEEYTIKHYSISGGQEHLILLM